MFIYADNAATTKMSRAAVEAMTPYLYECYGNPSSLYALGQRAKDAVEAAREKIARLIGAEAREITFTSGGSEADNQAILSAAAVGAKAGKRHIVSDAIEHHAVLHTLKKLEREGFEVTLLPVTPAGIVEPSAVEGAIREDTCLVTVMAANNEIGTIQPIEEIGEICRRRGVLFHTDAVQAVGHIPLDVRTIGCDLLSASAHKFHGPKGVGFLYARRGAKLVSLIEGGAQERGKRAGTHNVPGIVGFAKATQIAEKEMQENAAHEAKLRDRLIERILAEVPYCRLNGSRTERLTNNVNICFRFIEGESLLIMLDQAGVCASSGSACTSGSLDPSHVLLAIGLPHEIAHGSLRMTLSRETTEEEVDYTALIIALSDGKNNLKKLHFDQENHKYVLQSCNPDKETYADIVVDELQVQGVVIGAYHKFE